jgi:hypothetical protein
MVRGHGVNSLSTISQILPDQPMQIKEKDFSGTDNLPPNNELAFAVERT